MFRYKRKNPQNKRRRKLIRHYLHIGKHIVIEWCYKFWKIEYNGWRE